MRLFEISNNRGVPRISKQEAIDRHMFGPVYHGSANIDEILATGFDINRSRPTNLNSLGRPSGDGISNGYPFINYNNGLPAPIHHLGFACYFTTSKAIAKSFNGNSMRGIKEFYLDVPNLETINFGSQNTMMKWWKANGYNPSPDILKNNDLKEWIRATDNLTNELKSKYDAVYFKGKGLHKLLDGDQIAVFDASKIYVIDPKLSQGLDIGSKVYHNQTIIRDDAEYKEYTPSPKFEGWHALYNSNNYPFHIIPPKNIIGTIVSKRELPEHFQKMHNTKYFFEIKWKFGGTHHNYRDSEISPLK